MDGAQAWTIKNLCTFVSGSVLEELILLQHNFRIQFNGNCREQIITRLFVQNACKQLRTKNDELKKQLEIAPYLNNNFTVSRSSFLVTLFFVVCKFRAGNYVK